MFSADNLGLKAYRGVGRAGRVGGWDTLSFRVATNPNDGNIRLVTFWKWEKVEGRSAIPDLLMWEEPYCR